MPKDAIYRRLLTHREEDPGDVRRYIREAFYRHEAGREQVSPINWFQAPGEWQPPGEVTNVFEGLRRI